MRAATEMQLPAFLAELPGARVLAPRHRPAWRGEFRGLTPDVSRVGRDEVFVCLPDRAASHPFESYAAAERGASAVLCEPGMAVPSQVARIVVADARRAFAQAAAAFFGHPGRGLELIGVEPASANCRQAANATWLTAQLLRACGREVALFSELGCQAGGRELPRPAASLDAFEFQRLLAAHARAGGTTGVVELARQNEDRWSGLGFTQRFTAVIPPADGDVHSWRGSRLLAGGQIVFSSVVGTANAAALRTAVEAAIRLGVPRARAVGAIPGLGAAPGFLEPVSGGQPFGVFVDGARTAEELRRLLAEARSLTRGRLLLVTGFPASLGGEEHRALAVAARPADQVILTADDPGHEDPEGLIANALTGDAGPRALVEPDRHRAITRAIRLARAGDVVLLAGKGHRLVHEVEGAVLPFDDRVHALEALAWRGFGGNEL